MYRIFEIKYNDGVFAERIIIGEVDEACKEGFIKSYLEKRVKEYNKNPNKDYHITMENIREIKAS